MEAFMANNVLFDDTEDVITFITNIKNEKHNIDIFKYLKPIMPNDVVSYLIEHSRDPKKINKQLVESYIYKLSSADQTYCYYKNQFLNIIINSAWFGEKLTNIMKGETSDIEEFKTAFIDIAFYDNLIEDRWKRTINDKRKAVITIDTDSNFINLNNHIIVLNEKYGFNKDDKDQQQILLNFLIDIVTDVLKKIFWTLTTNLGVIERAKPIINMKNEFIYSRILLTPNKKNYAGIITSELGKRLKKPALDVKGLPILKKTSVPKALRKTFNTIVENDILKAEKINIKKIINGYDDAEAEITNSLKRGETQFLIPDNFKQVETYATPSGIMGVRGSLIWNACEPENQIVPPDKINTLKLNCKGPDDPRLEAMKEKFPKQYNAIMKRVFNVGLSENEVATLKAADLDISRFGFTCIAIPKSYDDIPEYLRPFIDYQAMVNTNMSSSFIILQSLGVYCDSVRGTQYKSNIISI